MATPVLFSSTVLPTFSQKKSCFWRETSPNGTVQL